MTLNENLIDHLAHLAKLQLTEEEKQRYLKDLSSILKYVEVIQKLTIQKEAGDLQERVVNSWRPDKIEDCGLETKEKIKAGFPEQKDNLLKVKAVFE